MKKIFAGGAALALAGAGSVAFAGPLGAQDELPSWDGPELSATISATTFAPGETVAVSSDENCTTPDGHVLYGLLVEVYSNDVFLADGPGDVIDPDLEDAVDYGLITSDRLTDLFEGTDAVAEMASGFSGNLSDEGDWSVSFAAPSVSDAYTFFASCWAIDEAELDFELEGLDDALDGVDEPGEECPDDEEPEVPEPAAQALTEGEEGDDGHDHGDEDGEDEAECVEDDGPEDELPEDPNEDWLVQTDLYSVNFTVTGGDAAPAAPVSGAPSFTG